MNCSNPRYRRRKVRVEIVETGQLVGILIVGWGWSDGDFEGIKIYSRGRRGDRNQAKCSILIPDRDDRSVHEIWAANILSHINTKVIIPIQNIPISPTVNLSPQARLTFCMFRVQIKSHGNNRIIWRHKNLLNISTVIEWKEKKVKTGKTLK